MTQKFSNSIRVAAVTHRRLFIYLISLLIIGIGIVWCISRISQLLANEHPQHVVWGVFSISIICLLILGHAVTNTIVQAHQKLSILHTVTLLMIIGGALLIRLYRLDILPYGIWFDEAAMGLDVRRMWQDASYQPIFSNANITYYHSRLYQISLILFGESSSFALRLPSTLFGTGATYLGFLVGREIKDNWFGLGMAFFLAISFWSINFSRIAMTGIDAVFMTLAAILFVLRSEKYSSSRNIFWLGSIIGIGLWFYAAFRFVVIAIAIFFSNLRYVIRKHDIIKRCQNKMIIP